MRNLTLCSGNGYVFSQSTNGDKHLAHFSYHLDKCPRCEQKFKFDSGYPVNAHGDFLECESCHKVIQWHDDHELDLTGIWIYLRDSYGWEYAREYCEKLASDWGMKLGVLVPLVHTPSRIGIIKAEIKDNKNV